MVNAGPAYTRHRRAGWAEQRRAPRERGRCILEQVNQLAQLALLAGASQKLIQIDEATIEAVQEELSLAR